VICPGNHDDRAAFRQYLLGQPGSSAPINQVHAAAGAILAVCDSSVPGQNEGYLEDETLQLPALAFHALTEEGQLTTHYRSVIAAMA
jgi:hypothetical protein